MSYHPPDSLDDDRDPQFLRRRADRCHHLAKAASSRKIAEALVELGDRLHSAARAAEKAKAA
jgi:hypothetical protein